MIPIADPVIGDEELKNLTEAVKSGWISSKGKFILEFEENFAKYCGVKYGVAVSNGTVALHLALVALGVGRGDEVVVPTLTFIASANAVRYAGGRPVFVDSQPDYWCMDPGKLEAAITPKTKAIMPVHLYGHPCDMDAVMDIAKRHNLFVVEDAAEAHGALYKGKTVGSFGDINCFSFYGNKTITTGEGGMCLTDNEELANKMRVLRDHGMNPQKRYWHDIIGFNYRMTNLQAAVGVAQLKRLDEFIQCKRIIAAWYAEGLKPLANEGIIKLPPEMEWARSIYWLYSILIEDSLKVTRDKMIEHLAKHGVDSRPVFYPLHVMPPYKGRKSFRIAEELSRKGISLPSGVTLTKSDIGTIVNAIISIA